MFESISRFMLLAGLILTAACGGSRAAETQAGSLDIAVDASRPGRADAPLNGSIMITALDRIFATTLALPRDSAQGGLRVQLPAGLYAIEGAAGSGVDAGGEPVIPVLSSPALVVVAPDRVSSVTVHSVESIEFFEFAALDAGLADR
jgi:hypothetical protein